MIQDGTLPDVEPAEGDGAEVGGPDVVVDLLEADEVAAELDSQWTLSRLIAEDCTSRRLEIPLSRTVASSPLNSLEPTLMARHIGCRTIWAKLWSSNSGQRNVSSVCRRDLHRDVTRA
jgi:hypothetical protein